MLPLSDNVPTRTFPLVTLALIGANLAVWVLYQLPDLEGSVYELGFFPCEADRSCPDQGVAFPLDVLTSMFAHGSWMHLLGNMLFLWIFGNNVEDALGRVRFPLFYVLAGVAAVGLQAVVTLAYGAPGDAEIPTVGASGAIAGVLGAYLVLYPRARVVTLVGFLLVRIPAAFFLVWWFLFQLWYGGFSLVEPQAGGGVAFFAHIGGFVFGVLAARIAAVNRRPRVAGPW